MSGFPPVPFVSLRITALSPLHHRALPWPPSVYFLAPVRVRSSGYLVRLGPTNFSDVFRESTHAPSLTRRFSPPVVVSAARALGSSLTRITIGDAAKIRISPSLSSFSFRTDAIIVSTVILSIAKVVRYVGNDDEGSKTSPRDSTRRDFRSYSMRFTGI